MIYSLLVQATASSENGGSICWGIVIFVALVILFCALPSLKGESSDTHEDTSPKVDSS